MIDLHSHVLPAIDDGPADITTSIELAAELAADGTRILAATPHARSDHPRVRVDELARHCRELEQRLPPGTELRVVPGAECDVLWASEASDEELVHASLGQRGTDLLVETPYGPLPPGFEDLLFGIAVRGYRLLLAHPERSPDFQRDPGRLAALAERGMLLQVTAVSLASTARRSPSRELARWLVKQGIAHTIASDAHGPDDGRPRLSEGVAAAARIAPLRARWMVTEAPAAILAGERLPRPPAERVRPGWRLMARRRPA